MFLIIFLVFLILLVLLIILLGFCIGYRDRRFILPKLSRLRSQPCISLRAKFRHIDLA